MQIVAIGTGLATAGLAMAASTTVFAKSAGPVQCELNVSSTGGGVMLTGVARAAIAASGSYSLIIAKDGDSGSADIEQGGNFSVGAGGSSTLSQVNINLERGASYSAILTVTSKSGSFTCRKALPMKL